MVRSTASICNLRHQVWRKNDVCGIYVNDGTFIQSRAAFAASDSVRSARRRVPSVRSAHEIARSRLLQVTSADRWVALHTKLRPVWKSILLQGSTDQFNACPESRF